MTINGVRIYDYTIEAENGRIGLFCHEFVHVFHIPDEYDPGYDSAATRSSSNFLLPSRINSLILSADYYTHLH